MLLAPTEEALVDERLERVGIGVAHDLGGLVVAAAGEDGEPPKEPLLFGIQEVVRPLDRSPERLLAGIGVTARFEQVEPLRQSIDELLRREDDGSCGGELERQREVVQARAELCHRFRLLHSGLHRPCAGQEELDAVFLLERRHRVHMLALELEPLAARDEQRRPGNVPQLGNPRRHVGHQVFGVVQHQERLLPGELSCDARG